MFIDIVLRRRRSLCPAPALNRPATPEAASPRPHPFLLPRPAVDQVYTIVMAPEAIDFARQILTHKIKIFL